MESIGSFTGDFAFLSNFYPAAVMLDGVSYSTAEHAYQAAKTLDPGERRMIRLLDSPGKAKRAGMQVTLRPGWESMKLEQMRSIVRDKFTRNPGLAQWLLATGTAHLAEGNDWGDRYWGVVKGVGANHLGRILMAIREELAGTA